MSDADCLNEEFAQEPTIGEFPLLKKIQRWLFVLGLLWAVYALGYLDGLARVPPWGLNMSVGVFDAAPTVVMVMFFAGGIALFSSGVMWLILHD